MVQRECYSCGLFFATFDHEDGPLRHYCMTCLVRALGTGDTEAMYETAAILEDADAVLAIAEGLASFEDGD